MGNWANFKQEILDQLSFLSQRFRVANKIGKADFQSR